MPAHPTSLAMIPEIVPILPLSGALLLPDTHRPLNIFEPRYIALVDHILGSNRLIGLIQPQETREESPKGNVPLQQIGCLGRLIHFEEGTDDHYLIVLEGIARFEIREEIDTQTPFRQHRIDVSQFASDFDPARGEDAIDRKRFLSTLRDYAEFADLELDWDEINETGTAELINLACMLSPYGPAEKQVFLEANSLEARAETLIAIAELEIARARSGTTLQ